MSEVFLIGTITEETTKTDKDNERFTVVKIRAEVAPDVSASLNVLIGRSCRVSIMDLSTYYDKRDKAVTNGQMGLPFDEGAAQSVTITDDGGGTVPITDPGEGNLHPALEGDPADDDGNALAGDAKGGEEDPPIRPATIVNP